jgi:putative photosynthetic complex assembly protein 2
MTQTLLPILYALFVWWFSTGIIMYLDGLPRRTFRWSMLGATVLLGISLYGLGRTSADASVTGAYAAFTFALLAWGWQEISFYTGYVTGPRKTACPADCSGLKHFWHAVETTLWHEVSILLTFGTVAWLTWDQPNQVGVWTFLVLWWMHESARLNVVLGVRNLNEEFLPEHLSYLRRYLKRGPMNLLFPVSVSVSTVIAVLMVQNVMAAESEFALAGAVFVATMMILAILEHWFLVIPLPAQALWNWSLKSRKGQTSLVAEAVPQHLAPASCTCNTSTHHGSLKTTGEVK